MPYPRDPGRKAPGTSQDAAQAITSHANVRDRVLAFLTERYPASFTADQIAAGLDENILTVRPRVSELHRSDSMSAQCWRAKVTGTLHGETVQ